MVLNGSGRVVGVAVAVYLGVMLYGAHTVAGFVKQGCDPSWPRWVQLIVAACW